MIRVFNGMTCSCFFEYSKSTQRYGRSLPFCWSNYSTVLPVPVLLMVKLLHGITCSCAFDGQITPRYYLFLSFCWSNYSTVLPVPVLLMVKLLHGITCSCPFDDHNIPRYDMSLSFAPVSTSNASFRTSKVSNNQSQHVSDIYPK